MKNLINIMFFEQEIIGRVATQRNDWASFLTLLIAWLASIVAIFLGIIYFTRKINKLRWPMILGFYSLIFPATLLITKNAEGSIIYMVPFLPSIFTNYIVVGGLSKLFNYPLTNGFPGFIPLAINFAIWFLFGYLLWRLFGKTVL